MISVGSTIFQKLSFGSRSALWSKWSFPRLALAVLG